MSIEDYKLEDDTTSVISISFDGAVMINTGCDVAIITKLDTIALAKHFKLTAHDIDCQTIKDMQDEIDLADEVHFDDLAECRATVMKHNKGIN